MVRRDDFSEPSIRMHGGLAAATRAARTSKIHLVELTDDKGQESSSRPAEIPSRPYVDGWRNERLPTKSGLRIKYGNSRIALDEPISRALTDARLRLPDTMAEPPSRSAWLNHSDSVGPQSSPKSAGQSLASVRHSTSAADTAPRGARRDAIF